MIPQYRGVVHALRDIVYKSYLPGGWRREPDGSFKPIEPNRDVTIHPDLIERARQALDALDKDMVDGMADMPSGS